MRWLPALLIGLSLLACKDKSQAPEQPDPLVPPSAPAPPPSTAPGGGIPAPAAPAPGLGMGEPATGAAVDTASYSDVEVKLDKSLSGRGVKVERAERRVGGEQASAVIVYLVFDRDFGGNMGLRARDSKAEAPVIAYSEVYRNRGDASSVEFSFDESAPLATLDDFILEEAPEGAGKEDGGAVGSGDAGSAAVADGGAQPSSAPAPSPAPPPSPLGLP